MKTLRSFLLILFTSLALPALSQHVHHLPFASTGNVVKLVIANTTNKGVVDVVVKLTDQPAWLRFAQREQAVTTVPPEGETLVFEELPAGYHRRVWDARSVASGVYLCRMEVHRENSQRVVAFMSMILMR